MGKKPQKQRFLKLNSWKMAEPTLNLGLHSECMLSVQKFDLCRDWNECIFKSLHVRVQSTTLHLSLI